MILECYVINYHLLAYVYEFLHVHICSTTFFSLLSALVFRLYENTYMQIIVNAISSGHGFFLALVYMHIVYDQITASIV